MAEILRLVPETVGEDYRFETKEILEAAKDAPFRTIAIIGQMDDKSLWVSSSANAGETMILIEKAKQYLLGLTDVD